MEGAFSKGDCLSQLKYTLFKSDTRVVTVGVWLQNYVQAAEYLSTALKKQPNKTTPKFLLSLFY